MTQVTSYLLIRQGSASKLGPNASGLIHYAVLTSTDRAGIYIALTANESKGCFSREAVPLSCLEQCTQGLAADTPLRSSAFKPAFKGQSVNNSGFMAAVLVAEGLLNKDPMPVAGRGQALIDNGLWSVWREDCLNLTKQPETQLPVFRIGPPEHQAGKASPQTQASQAEQASHEQAAPETALAETAAGEAALHKAKRKGKPAKED